MNTQSSKFEIIKSSDAAARRRPALPFTCPPVAGRSRLLAVTILFFSLIGFPPVRPAASAEQTKREIVVVGTARNESRVRADVNLWAVVIGVSRYEKGDLDIGGNKIPNLKYAADDAQAMYDFLSSPEGGEFRDVKEGGHMILLKDEQATRAAVERALGSLKQAKPNDYFMIYIAAHGMLAQQLDPASKRTVEVPRFVLYDTDLSDLTGTAIRMEFVQEIVREIPAKRGLVIADTCNSAGVQMAGRGVNDVARANERFIHEMEKIPEGVGFISAADQTESSLESDDFAHGVFTYCLLEALGGLADSDLDGIVTFLELKTYLRDSVGKLTDGKQHPISTSTTLEANKIALSVTPYPDSGAGGEYGLLKIRTPDIDGVQVAIDGAPICTLDSHAARTVKVKAGLRNLSFVKGEITSVERVQVAAGKTQSVEVNLSFSEGSQDAAVDQASRQINVFLQEPATPTDRARQLFRDAIDEFNKQKFEAAIQLFSRAAEANGGAYQQAFVYRGRAEQSLGRQKAAAISFKRALDLKPSDYETKTLLAEAKFRGGSDVEEAARELREVIRNHPEFEEARVRYADVLLSRRDYLGAERQLTRAINSNPNYAAAHMVLADVLTNFQSKEKLKQSIQEAEKALRLFDEVSHKKVSMAHGLARLSISHVLFNGGSYLNKTAVAESHYHLAHALNLLVELDEGIAGREASLDEARKHIQESMKLAQESSDKGRLALALDLSAQNYLLKGQVPQAIQDGEQALRFMEVIPYLKDYPDAHFTLYQAYKSQQKYRKAEEHLKKYIEVSRSHLDPEERARFEEELKRIKQLGDTIKE